MTQVINVWYGNGRRDYHAENRLRLLDYFSKLQKLTTDVDETADVHHYLVEFLEFPLYANTKHYSTLQEAEAAAADFDNVKSRYWDWLRVQVTRDMSVEIVPKTWNASIIAVGRKAGLQIRHPSEFDPAPLYKINREFRVPVGAYRYGCRLFDDDVWSGGTVPNFARYASVKRKYGDLC